MSGSIRTAAFALCLLFTSAAQADYSVSEAWLVEHAAAIVDATVTGFDAQGHAALEVHATWAGALADPVLKGVSYTCLMGSARDAGLKVGARYVILVDKNNNLFEETSAYLVEGGQVKGTRFVKDWQPRAWMPLKAFRQAITKLRRP